MIKRWTSSAIPLCGITAPLWQAEKCQNVASYQIHYILPLLPHVGISMHCTLIFTPQLMGMKACTR